MIPKVNTFVKNQKGSVMVTVLMVSAIIILVTLALTSYFKQMEKSAAQTNTALSATMIKENIMSIVDNEAAWVATLNAADNTNLNCLKTDGLTCGASDLGNISIYDADGTKVTDNLPTSGFTSSGKSCATFGDLTANDDCIYKYTVAVSCVGACTVTKIPVGYNVATSPKIKITAMFDHRPKGENKFQLATDKPGATTLSIHAINFVRLKKKSSLSDFCSSINGVFNSQTKKCIAPGAMANSFDCRVITGNPDARFLGLASDGTPQCGLDPKAAVNCGPGSGIIGYNVNGEYVCGGF